MGKILSRITKKVLNACGITKVVVHYSGSDDNGSIDDTQFFDSEGVLIELSKHPTISILQAKGREQDIFKFTLNDIEDFVYGKLPSGWEINSGSQGDITINLKEKEAVMEHETNINTIECSGGTFKI